MIIIGTPHASGAGYFRNDDTPSGGKKEEADVRTCTHCQRVLKMQLWKEEGAFCHRCNAPICTECGKRMDKYGCEPFLAKLERSLTEDYHRRQFCKLAGLE